MDELLKELAAEKEKTQALQSSYDEERLLRLKTEGRLHDLRCIHEKLACNAEMSEEFIVNKLICKMEKAKRDKEQMAIDLEREEECLTNNLQKKLRSIKFEKEQTEKEVEDLKKQLEKMKLEQEKIARSVEAEQELLSNNLLKKLQKTMLEKSELENQLCRSNSRNSTCSSLNSSITGRPDSPSLAPSQLSGSFPNEFSLLLSYKKMSESAMMSPRRKPPLSPGASQNSNSSENVFM